jgi:hypothetical protein
MLQLDDGSCLPLGAAAEARLAALPLQQQEALVAHFVWRIALHHKLAPLTDMQVRRRRRAAVLQRWHRPTAGRPAHSSLAWQRRALWGVLTARRPPPAACR